MSPDPDADPSAHAFCEIVDPGDLSDVAAALAAALTGEGLPVLAPATADRDRILSVLPRSAAALVVKPAALVATSGSTGHPKLALLSADALVSSAGATTRRLGGPGRWLLCLPLSGIAGLQVVTRSLLAGETPVVVGPSATVEELADAVADRGDGKAIGSGRWYTALVPTQLHRLLREPAGPVLLRRFDAVLLGGAAAPPGLLASARSAGVAVVTTYGMTETAGGCVYDGRPLDGVAVAVGSDGRIRIGGPTLFDGYLGDPAESRRVLAGGWFRTADLGRIDDHGLLVVRGRSDDVAVSGGVNVSLPAVADRLTAHPGISAAVAVGVPDEEWGTAVVAFVVGADTPTLAGDPTDDLRAWVAADLGRASSPRRIVVLEAIPMLANGKPDRRELLRLATLAEPGEPSDDPRRP